MTTDSWYASMAPAMPQIVCDTGTYTVTGQGAVQASRYYDVPANTAVPGMCFQFQAWGYGKQGGTSRQINAYLQAFGINNNGMNSMMPATIGATYGFWFWYDAILMIITAGPSGSAVIGGTMTWSQSTYPTSPATGTTTSNAATSALGETSSALTIDTTADSAIGLNLGWSTADGPSITCVGSMLMITNPAGG